MDELGVSLDDAHRIDGLRMIANRTVRQLEWPGIAPFPAHGAVWPRRKLDARLMELAGEAGAELEWQSEALPTLDGGRVTGVQVGERRFAAPLVVVAAGAPGQVARMLGAERDPDEPFGLAIRTYAEITTPRRALPGGVPHPPRRTGHRGARLRLDVPLRRRHREHRRRCAVDHEGVQAAQPQPAPGRATAPWSASSWDLGPDLERPRAWRLPMSTVRRHGPGWVAIGDAAGLVNPMNGEGIDYGLESGMLAADLFLADPATAPARYDREVGERFDAFLRTGRRFSFLIGHPWILRSGLRVAVGTHGIANITLQVMGNLVDSSTPGAGGMAMRTADRVLGVADPLLRRTRAAA